MPRRTPILPNPQTLLRASIFLCKWQLKAPRHGGRGGGRIKAQAARLPLCGGGGGWVCVHLSAHEAPGTTAAVPQQAQHHLRNA